MHSLTGKGAAGDYVVTCDGYYGLAPLSPTRRATEVQVTTTWILKRFTWIKYELKRMSILLLREPLNVYGEKNCCHDWPGLAYTVTSFENAITFPCQFLAVLLCL